MTDTTDRENLELAAKAAGMIPKEFVGNRHFMDGLLERWNPRHNNNDSFGNYIFNSLFANIKCLLIDFIYGQSYCINIKF